jgi:hypothetical protein
MESPNLMISHQDFQVLQKVTTDDKGGINLGKTATAQRYRVLVNAAGQILLDPIVPIPDREQWLWQNAQALASVQLGLAQAAQGETVTLGAFTQYADLDIDD